MRVKRQEYKNGKIVETRVKEFKNLKSKDSYRTIGIKSEEMLNMLKEHKEEQKQLAKKCNKTFNETDWVFTTKNYEGYVADYSSDKFRKVMDTIKIKNYKELTLHDLRHTYCSLGIMAGVKVEEMKEILGHNNIGVTAGWYLHLDEQNVIDASNKVTNNIMGMYTRKGENINKKIV